MWWRRRQFLASTALLGLGSACTTFRPLHQRADGVVINTQLASIEIPQSRSRSMQVLRNAVLDRLNPAAIEVASRHRLDLTLARRRTSLAVQLDDRITRYDMTLTAGARLVALDTDQLVYQTRIARTASYNVLDEPFATLVAERDAERRASIEIANQLRALLALHFEKQARNPGS